MHAHAIFKVCLVLIFLNTIVEKTYPEINILYQFLAQKALFKALKFCNIIFFIENAPSLPLALLQKFIRFGIFTLPLAVINRFLLLWTIWLQRRAC